MIIVFAGVEKVTNWVVDTAVDMEVADDVANMVLDMEFAKVANKVADMGDMEVDKVAVEVVNIVVEMEVDKVAAMVVDIETAD